MQLINIIEAMQNFIKYYDDVVTKNDVVIVSKDNNLNGNMVLVDFNTYTELQKAKETLDCMVSSGKGAYGLGMNNITPAIAYVPVTQAPIAPPIMPNPAVATPQVVPNIPNTPSSPVNTPDEINPAHAETLYELCRYSDGTSVTFSDIVKGSSGEDCVQVNFERSSYYGDDAIRFELPSYKVLFKKGHYSDDEISRFKDTLYKNEQSFYKWAREGGPQITVY